MWKLLGQQQSQGEPTPDLRAQLQPFQGCSQQQIQEQLQSLHIQPDTGNSGVLPVCMAHQHSDFESSLSSSAQSESGHTSGSSSSVASSSRKSSAGSSLIALLSPTPTVPVAMSQPQATPSYVAYSPPSAEHMATLHPHRRFSHQVTAGVHAPTSRQKRCVVESVCMWSLYVLC